MTSDRALLSLIADDQPLVVRDGILRARDVAGDETRMAWDEEHGRADAAAPDIFVTSALDLIRRHASPAPDTQFLELGCGPMRIGAALADQGVTTVGIDFSMTALRHARAELERRGHPVRLVFADVRATPFRDSVFDVVYGGGVIEHMRDLDVVLRELHRITAPGGVTVNTVPYLSLGSLTYRQLWGNIPAVPVLQPLAEFVHLRLLRGRHMRFGYERSYLATTLSRAFRRAGFADIVVRRYDVPLVFEYLPPRVRPLAARLARHRLFWPMVYVVARKPA